LTPFNLCAKYNEKNTFRWTPFRRNGIVPIRMVSLRNIRMGLAITVAVAIIAIVAIIFQKGSRKSAVPEPVPHNTPSNIDLTLNKARFSEMREGKVEWILVADKAEYDKSGEKVFLTGINMEFPKSDSSGKVTVTALKGEYIVKSKNMKLRGDVHMVTEDGAVFDTEWVDYHADRSRFTTTAPVRFKHQRLDLTARGMEMDVKVQKAYFHKPVDADVAGLKSR